MTDSYVLLIASGVLCDGYIRASCARLLCAGNPTQTLECSLIYASDSRLDPAKKPYITDFCALSCVFFESFRVLSVFPVCLLM